MKKTLFFLIFLFSLSLFGQNDFYERVIGENDSLSTNWGKGIQYMGNDEFLVLNSTSFFIDELLKIDKNGHIIEKNSVDFYRSAGINLANDEKFLTIVIIDK